MKRRRRIPGKVIPNEIYWICKECGERKHKCLCGHYGCDCIDRHPCPFEDEPDFHEMD